LSKRKRQGSGAWVQRDVRRELLDLLRKTLRFHPKAGVGPILLRRESERAVLAVRIDNDAGHLVAKELLYEHPQKVALTASGFGEHAHVALDELVDVQFHAQGVAPK